MDRGFVLFIGCTFTFTAAWLGLVVAPIYQMNNLAPQVDENTNTNYPTPLGGLAARGVEVYKANGCIYCHSQQVRPRGFGVDIERGWGERRTVARDYLYDRPLMLGTMRTGPDLANISVRQPSQDWHHKHLYNPRMMVPGSIMPSFAFLYEKRAIKGEPSINAIQGLTREWSMTPGHRYEPSRAERKQILDSLQPGSNLDVDSPEAQALVQQWLQSPEPGYEIVPTGEGEALVAYLLSLNKQAVDLPEARE
ncbi:cbb3-type cytochrome c oxidase subunit II [Tuwongella immobilis]|uniref:Cytochrome c domain-containing protein n=1 Tax=Tuwongella immobilis TaxID=692036 RepID=A0A6C2YN43_9BACT|nr:cbb3-type cytochrome c oxidase subunit II [Tuwongella immobilis]VIP02797.1 cytochrome c oxidase mono-heme subunit : Cytochrome C oxidase mono-heme subunit/FixO OS=Isosphaera pallida (strain ATCC 43644 / DSM 9630 / IS1B) GN=Isop_0397 PE=4 SV=1: FixO [Tuwongella immobilis]VTS02479.1 cytochrome c oxidase mono-heme subunit : Cytochrome C oxidase mono-heme subunit/FixO OS=Isosphaera pallida (strain ATCC 43644 / DSM 9630 / IS1B) GN=Isop_0397 PE=4 SV=1: FixO [Tuwongella immobilis]